MTRDIFVGVEIQCDGDDCNEKIIIPAEDVSLFPQVDIKEAEKKGWHCKWNKDLCPICFTER